MIKFFRKIRQKLLSENKFSKYLIYALGEIILVVIGILIALQINNWNEIRKVNSNQLKYLNLLKKEALTNVASLDIHLGTVKELTEGQKEVFRIIDAPKDTLSEEYISKSFFKAFSTLIKFDYNNSVLTEIKNSGELKNIKNDSIWTALIELEPLIENVRIQENALNILQENMLEQINLNGDLRLIMDNVGYNTQLGIEAAHDISKGNKPVLNNKYFKNF